MFIPRIFKSAPQIKCWLESTIEINFKKTYTETSPALSLERNSVMHNHRHPIHCILPPHVLKEIAANGTETQKQTAIDTINGTVQLRAERLKMAEYRMEFTSAT